MEVEIFGVAATGAASLGEGLQAVALRMLPAGMGAQMDARLLGRSFRGGMSLWGRHGGAK